MILTSITGEKPFIEGKFFTPGTDFAEHSIEAKIQIQIGIFKNQNLNNFLNEMKLIEDGVEGVENQIEFQMFRQINQLLNLLLEGDESLEISVFSAGGVKTIQFANSLSQISCNYPFEGEEGEITSSFNAKSIQEVFKQQIGLVGVLGNGWCQSLFLSERRLVFVVKNEGQKLWARRVVGGV